MRVAGWKTESNAALQSLHRGLQLKRGRSGWSFWMPQDNGIERWRDAGLNTLVILHCMLIDGNKDIYFTQVARLYSKNMHIFADFGPGI